MPQEALVAIAYRDEEEHLAGFVTIRLPDGGDPADAGEELLELGEDEATASELRGKGFRGHKPRAHPQWNYKQVMFHAKDEGIPHVYRLQDGSWEYQQTQSMYRSSTLNRKTLEQFKEGHRLRTKATMSAERIPPPEFKQP